MIPCTYASGAEGSATISAAVASFVERYEFGPIDDNVLIVVASGLVLLLGLAVGPL